MLLAMDDVRVGRILRALRRCRTPGSRRPRARVVARARGSPGGDPICVRYQPG